MSAPTLESTAVISSAYRVSMRPVGDFVIQRYDRATSRIIRWGVYPTRKEAESICRIANVSQSR